MGIQHKVLLTFKLDYTSKYSNILSQNQPMSLDDVLVCFVVSYVLSINH